VSKTLSNRHRSITSRASGLVQIAKALTDIDYSSKVGFCLLIVLSLDFITVFALSRRD
jgi:hypothetical protein